MLARIGRVYHWMIVVTGWFVEIVLALLLLLFILDIIGRTIFNIEIVLDATVFARVLFLTILFLALILVQQEGRQIAIDIVTQRLGERQKRLASTLALSVALAFFGAIGWWAWANIGFAIATGDHMDAVHIEVPRAIPLAVIGVTTGATCLVLLQQLTSLWLGKRQQGKETTI